MSEPTTEAGRALWEAYGGTTASAAIRAIEREAYAKVLQDIEERKAYLGWMNLDEAMRLIRERATLMGDDDGR